MIPTLHLVTDDDVLEDPDFPAKLRAVAQVGDRSMAVHLRGPGRSASRLRELADTLRGELGPSGVRFLVNDRIDVAMVADADGAHLGGRSLPPDVARRLLGRSALIGRSVHGAAEARRTAGGYEGAGDLDFLIAGTIYDTPSHPGRPGAGPARVREVREAAPSLPVVAIGGITPERVPELLGAGAHGVAVLRAVWAARDPGGAASVFRRALEEVSE